MAKKKSATTKPKKPALDPTACAILRLCARGLIRGPDLNQVDKLELDRLIALLKD